MQLHRRAVVRIEARGYESGLGALHEFRPGRPSMACDIMEPLRIPVVDRWVLAACAQGIVKKSDFETLESGAVMLAKGRIGNVLTRLEEHWHQGNFEQILEQHELTGGFGTLLQIGYDYADLNARDGWFRSMELLATEVMPRVNARLAAGQATRTSEPRRAPTAQ